MATFKDFRNKVKPNWCPGCGDFSVLAAMQRAFANLGLEPEDVALFRESAVPVGFLDISMHMVSMGCMVVRFRLPKVKIGKS